MDFVESNTKESLEIVKSISNADSLVAGVRDAISSISGATVKRFFDDNNVGRKQAGLSTTIGKLLLFEFEDRGWQRNYRFSENDNRLNSSLYSFDAATVLNGGNKKIASLDIAFDNRQKLGTLLLKPEAARANRDHQLDNLAEVAFHIQILATKEFKDKVGIDSSSCTFEEYLVASEVFQEVLSVPTLIFGLSHLEGVRLIQRKDGKSRKKSQLIREE
jgi:hypothetical protein